VSLDPASTASGLSGPVLLALRPHGITVSAAPREAGAEGRLWHPARVLEREFLGEFIRYRVKAGEAELVCDCTHRSGDAGHGLDSEVWVGMDPGDMGLLRD
jgi:ABC-type Fe3+/spermidine/putrescine transport system ATPase subunit